MAATRDTLFNFRRDTDTPLDDWITVATLSGRDAIPAGVRHLGQFVFVEEDGNNYQLVGGIENSNWSQPSGGSGQTEGQVNNQINAIRTSGELLTFPNGDTFAAGTGGGALTSATILAVLNAASGSIDADLLGNASGDSLPGGVVLQPTDDTTIAAVEGDIVIGTSGSLRGNIYSVGSGGPGTVNSNSGFTNSAFTLRGNLATKQDTISDLATIRSGAALGATSSQTDTNTQLTSETILSVLNGASGNIDADLLTLGGGGGGGHEFEQQRRDSLGGLSFFFLGNPDIPDTAERSTGLQQKQALFAGYTSRIYYFGRIPAGDSRTITGSGFENDIDSFFEAGTEDDELIFIRKLIG